MADPDDPGSPLLPAAAIRLGRAKTDGVGKYSTHGLWSGFLTEAANQEIPLQDAMLQSRHRSLAQASAHYNEASP